MAEHCTCVIVAFGVEFMCRCQTLVRCDRGDRDECGTRDSSAAPVAVYAGWLCVVGGFGRRSCASVSARRRCWYLTHMCAFLHTVWSMSPCTLSHEPFAVVMWSEASSIVQNHGSTRAIGQASVRSLSISSTTSYWEQCSRQTFGAEGNLL